MQEAITSVCVLSLVLAACGNDGASGASSAAAEAKRVWSDKCVTCHGEDGKGRGPGSMALDPKPRSFTDPKWQTYTSDERIAKVIVQGGGAVGLSPGMAPNPDLVGKDEVVAELVKLVRGFQ